MRYTLAVCLGFALTGFAAAQSPDVTIIDHDHGPQPTQAATNLYVASDTLDLGTVREGAVVNATFKVENRGEENLVITSVQASCGCTAVKLTDEEKTIAPGETRDIVAMFDTKGRLGMQRKYITLMTNDPGAPSYRLTLQAQVETLFRVTPSTTINMRSTQRGEKLQPLVIEPTDAGKDIELLEVTTEGVPLRHEADISESGRIKLLLTVPDEVDLGPVNSGMTIRCRVGDEEAAVPIRLVGQIVGDIVARPILLQSLAATTRGHRFAPVILASPTGKSFNVLSADAGPHVDVQFAPVKNDGSEYQFRTTLKDTAPDGPLAAELVVTTDNPTQPVVSIPVFVNVMPRYRVEPAIVLFDPSQPQASRRIRIQNGSPRALEILEVRCDNPDVKVKVDSVDELRADIVYLMVHATGASSGEAVVVIKTNQQDAPELRIPVRFNGKS